MSDSEHRSPFYYEYNERGYTNTPYAKNKDNNKKNLNGDFILRQKQGIKQ